MTRGASSGGRADYPGGYYWELHGHPLAAATVEDLDRYPWPDPLDPALTAGLAGEIRRLHGTPYAIVADGGFKSFWELGYMLRGLEQLLVDLVADPGFVTALMEKLLELNLAGTRRFLEIAGPYIQVFRAADDLATQTGLLMSPEVYRSVLKPVYRRYFEQVHAMTDAKLFYHSCGCVNELIDDLIEIGVDIINPVQVSAMGDTARLKERFGSKVTFWGGIDTQRVLPHGHAGRRRAGGRPPHPRPGARAAATWSPRSTTSSPTSRPRTWSPWPRRSAGTAGTR